MILVTGATGTVGRNVVDLLLAAGEQVRAMTRNPATAHLPPAVEVVQGDLRRPETLPPALDGIERAYLFPVSGYLEHFLQAGRQATLQRVVLLSSQAADTAQQGTIGRSHAANEEAVRQSGLDWTFLRPGAFMANDLQWAVQIQHTNTVQGAYGQAATAPIDERDIAAVAVAALLRDGHAGQAYTLSGPESLTQIERVAILSEVLGRELHWQELTQEEARQRLRDVPPQVADSLLAMFQAMVGVEARISPAVAQVTGRPATPYRRWVARHKGEFERA